MISIYFDEELANGNGEEIFGLKFHKVSWDSKIQNGNNFFNYKRGETHKKMELMGL